MCLSTKFSHQEFRWNYGISRSDGIQIFQLFFIYHVQNLIEITMRKMYGARVSLSSIWSSPFPHQVWRFSSLCLDATDWWLRLDTAGIFRILCLLALSNTSSKSVNTTDLSLFFSLSRLQLFVIELVSLSFQMFLLLIYYSFLI